MVQCVLESHLSALVRVHHLANLSSKPSGYYPLTLPMYLCEWVGPCTKVCLGNVSGNSISTYVGKALVAIRRVNTCGWLIWS
jgi:hypothetical protein